jgi:hypothetical protein
MSNDNPFASGAQPQGMQPQFQPAKKSNALLIVVIIAAASIPMMCVCAGLLLPAVQAAREAARRMSCSNNMKQIGLALHNYHSAYGSLPPAYTVDGQGRPLHSWRSLILPFMEQQALHGQIDFSKPWDDPVNSAVADSVVPTYGCPSTLVEPTYTTYVAVVDPAGMMTGSTAVSFGEVTDGLANTLLITETDSASAVHWMSPQDVDVQAFMNAGTRRDSGGHIGGSNNLLGDGAVMFFADSMDPGTRELLVSKDDGRPINVGL